MTKIKSWEKALRASLKLEVAELAISKQARDWVDFGRQGAVALVNELMSFEHTEWRYTTCAMSGTSKHVAVAATQVTVTDDHIKAANRYNQILGNLEVTSDLVLTDAQRRVLEPMMTTKDVVWQVWWCYRLKHTGATAVCLRNGTDWMTVFEDGTFSKNQFRTEFYSGAKSVIDTKNPNLYGSWHFNKKTKREYLPPVLKDFGFNLKTGQIQIRAK